MELHFLPAIRTSNGVRGHKGASGERGLGRKRQRRGSGRRGGAKAGPWENGHCEGGALGE